MVTERGSCRPPSPDELEMTGERAQPWSGLVRELYWRAKIHNLSINDKILLIAGNRGNRAVWVNALVLSVTSLVVYFQWGQAGSALLILGLSLLAFLDLKVCWHTLDNSLFKKAAE